mmetsp:Transcript_129935/g.363665  ORF Transcript_129935/g.363665 Transcript_129935/m.363665 type:complete len:442 (+) Transcript_129935:116-1441(+)
MPSTPGGLSDVVHADSWRWETKVRFHERAVFCGLWTIVFLVGMQTMRSLRPILEPVIWAFFLMMALLPLCDLIECVLARGCALLPTPLCCRGAWKADLQAEADTLERQYTGLAGGERRRERVHAAESADEGHSEESSSSSEEKSTCGCLRLVAVLITICVFLGCAILFVGMIYRSASHMQSVWRFYVLGANNMLGRIRALRAKLPDEIAGKVASRTLQTMEEIVSFLVGTVFEHIASIMFEIMMTLLYMMFWLCQPVFVGETVTALFKQYILLKTFASVMYAFCIYMLLEVLGVDLAIVFGLITFLFNFVPEVGTIAAMLLPVPVILFDGRLERPLLNLMLALAGQFCLKFIFSNIIEVKLVERQNDFRMHPVTILFFVAFFGGVWGPTGMLVSVPIVATAKAASEVMPPPYRDAILVFLEGDKEAPARFRRRKRSRGTSV